MWAWSGKIPTQGFTASFTVLPIAGICSCLKWWLPRQTTLFNTASTFYWIQLQRFKHEVGAVNFWTVQGESCPSSGHRSRPLQTRILSTFILPLSLSNAAKSFRLLEKLPERLGRFHREKSRQGQRLPLQQKKRAVSSDPKKNRNKMLGCYCFWFHILAWRGMVNEISHPNLEQIERIPLPYQYPATLGILLRQMGVLIWKRISGFYE